MNNIQKIIDIFKTNNLLKNLSTLILIFIALFMIAKTVLTYKQAVAFKDPTNLNFLSVNGKAEEYIIPDTLNFNITITEEGKDISDITLKVKEKVDNAIKILTENGIEKENIKLESYYISDKYENVSEPCAYPTNSKMMSYSTDISPTVLPCQVSNSKIVGQILTQTMSVKVRDIEKNANNEKRNKIIGELSAKNIKADGFNFTVYDIETVQKNIREKAIKNAKEDAKKLAKDLGISLDKVTSFSDNSSPAFPLYSEGGNDMMIKSARASSAPSAPELTPGQQKIVSNVTLTYSIK